MGSIQWLAPHKPQSSINLKATSHNGSQYSSSRTFPKPGDLSTSQAVRDTHRAMASQRKQCSSLKTSIRHANVITQIRIKASSTRGTAQKMTFSDPVTATNVQKNKDTTAHYRTITAIKSNWPYGSPLPAKFEAKEVIQQVCQAITTSTPRRPGQAIVNPRSQPIGNNTVPLYYAKILCGESRREGIQEERKTSVKSVWDTWNPVPQWGATHSSPAWCGPWSTDT